MARDVGRCGRTEEGGVGGRHARQEGVDDVGGRQMDELGI